MKVCTRTYDDVHIMLNTVVRGRDDGQQVYEIEMPIGQYSDCEVYPTCGMANAEAMIIKEDEPASFYHPNHVGAGIIWFRKGYVEYLMPLEISYNFV